MSNLLSKVLILLCCVPITAHSLTPVYCTNAYKPTVELWVKVYDELLNKNATVRGTTYIQPVKGNGVKDKRHKNLARDTIVFIPDGTTLMEPVDLIFYFHGLGGFKERDFKTRTLRHTVGFPPEKNYVLVIPEMPWSQHTSTPRTRQGYVFTHKDSFPTFVRTIMNIVNTHFSKTQKTKNVLYKIVPDTAILLGHSAGGSTIMALSRSGGLNWLHKHAEALSIKIIFSDAAYDHWVDITWRYFRRTRSAALTQFILLTRKWDKPYKHTVRFLKRFKKVPPNIQFVVFNRKEKTHGDIGDEALTWVYPPIENMEEDEEGFGCGEGEDYE